MAQALGYKIEGLEELTQDLQPALIGGPLRRFFERAAMAIENRAKRNAPVDTGRLRSSLTHQVDGAEVPKFAKVGTNVKYAPFMEFGTGLFAEGEGGKGGRHWPPGAPLDLWASRHGFASEAQVAAIIGRRGGLKPRRYLRNALRDSVGDVRAFLRKCGEEIKASWDRS